MHKQDLAAEYIAIETKYPLKADRSKKLEELITSLQHDSISFSLQEIEDIIHEIATSNTVIRMPLFSKVLHPVINQGIIDGDIKAIKILLSLTQQLYQYQSLTKEYTHTSASLIREGLKIDPDDKELLDLYEKDTRSYLLYTVHELPTGILYNSNSADIQACDELLDLLADYEQACHKLQLNRSESILEYRFYYFAYKDYLLNKSLYHNFKDYLTESRERQ